MKTVISILGYTAHTPKHVPAGWFILGAVLVLWVILRRRNISLTEFCSALGILGIGAGVIIWALRWKPATTNTYPVVNHNTTVNPVVNHVVTAHGGLNLWQEIVLGLLIAFALALIGAVIRRLH